jgi:hypothetical protein
MEALEFYVVRSKDGKYLRAKGYSGSGDNWVTELKGAKVYTKRGPALSQITWWSNNYPKYGIPELVPLIATLGEPIDQTERVTKVKRKQELNKTKSELLRAQEEFDKAKRELERHRSRDIFLEKFNEVKSKMEELEDKINQFKQK